MPYKGNLSKHLEAYEKFVNEQIKDSNFSGVVCIDMESWRPIFDQLYGTMTKYKTATCKDICDTENPFSDCKEKAAKIFEAGAKKFMLETLIKSEKELRPDAKWGYYIFPLCWMETDGNCSYSGQMQNNR